MKATKEDKAKIRSLLDSDNEANQINGVILALMAEYKPYQLVDYVFRYSEGWEQTEELRCDYPVKDIYLKTFLGITIEKTEANGKLLKYYMKDREKIRQAIVKIRIESQIEP